MRLWDRERGRVYTALYIITQKRSGSLRKFLPYQKTMINPKLKYKEAAPKSSVTGGVVKTFPNKKGLVRRMTMIQSALDSADLREHINYPEQHQNMCTKFSTWL